MTKFLRKVLATIKETINLAVNVSTANAKLYVQYLFLGGKYMTTGYSCDVSIVHKSPLENKHTGAISSIHYYTTGIYYT